MSECSRSTRLPRNATHVVWAPLQAIYIRIPGGGALRHTHTQVSVCGCALKTLQVIIM